MNRSTGHRLNQWMIGFMCSVLLGWGFSVLGQSDIETISPWRGREIFEQKGCIQCHAINGSGGSDAPDLGQNRYYGTYLELASLMWNHIPGMIEKIDEKNLEFPYLSEKETIHLLRYISYIRYWGEPGNERAGRELLEKKNCTSCHKFGSKGGDTGPDFTQNDEYLSPISLAVSMWNHLPEMLVMAKKMNIDQPKFEGDEIIDLASGIESYMRPTKIPVSQDNIGNPSRGEQLIRKVKCLHCHNIDGDGGKLAPDFMQINFNYSVTEIAGIMWNHGADMYLMMQKEGLEYPELNEEDMADIIAFLYGIHMQSSNGNIALGNRLINERGCLNCHQLNGQGSDLAVDLSKIGKMNSPINMIAAMWNHAPAMHDKLIEKNIDWPQLDKFDMANLYAYLQTVSQ